MGKKRARRESDETILAAEDDDELELEYVGTRLRNADSDVEDDEVETVEDEDEEAARERKRQVKRLHSGTEDGGDDVMDGSYDYDLPAQQPSTSFRPSAPSSSSRRAPAPSLVSSSRHAEARRRQKSKLASSSSSTSHMPPLASRASAALKSRRPGDEWRTADGQRFKLGADGVRRRLCEVRETRKKYKMPKDSLHPDKDVLHEVRHRAVYQRLPIR